MPEAKIIVGFWGMSDDEVARIDPQAASGADRVARSLDQATRFIDDMIAEDASGRDALLAKAEASKL